MTPVGALSAMPKASGSVPGADSILHGEDKMQASGGAPSSGSPLSSLCFQQDLECINLELYESLTLPAVDRCEHGR